MKPVNFDSAACSPISSNCVIWQGPDISCINLCNGDTISDVVYKLATELCTIMNTLNVSNYDLSCFNITACGPNDFTALIQFLIEKICELEGITPAVAKSGGDCPTDCIVTVAECFQKTLGLTSNLVDYVNAIAARICEIGKDIIRIDATLSNHESRLTIIETTYCKDCNFEMPSAIVTCPSLVNAGVNTGPVQTVVTNFFSIVWCDFFASVAGTTQNGTDLTTLEGSYNPAAPCDITDFNVLYPNGLNLNLDSANTLPQALANIWQILCALKTPVKITGEATPTIRTTVTGGPSFTVSSYINDTGWVDLEGFAYMSSLSSRPQCRRIGNQVIFRGVIQIPMGSSGNGASGTVISATGPDHYRTTLYAKVLDAGLSVDPNACLMYSSGNIPSTDPLVNRNEGIAIYFNRGARVIPASIMDATVDFDQAYTAGNRQIVNRGINISATGATLATHINFAIAATGELYLTSPYSVENYAGAYIDNSSILRSIVSNITSGENIPLYLNTAPSNSNAPGTSAYQVDLDGSATTWPFSANCNNAYELGGFSVRLDGLFAYISPCEKEVVDYATCS